MRNSLNNFNNIFQIVSNPKFLNMEGLGNEVPFFVQTYDIKEQAKIYSSILALYKRLNAEGIQTVLISLYEMVIDYFNKTNELEDLFKFEKEVDKKEFFNELSSTVNKDDVIIPYFKQKLKEANYQLILVYQVGEVFPFLRSHNILNYLQSVITEAPVIWFFPGEYITSYAQGFKLNLFGIFEGPYYRAFKLEDYLIRGNIDVSIE